jgi:hypothetical protein
MQKTIDSAIMALHSKHGNAIAIFGGAYHAVKHNNDMGKFVEYLPHVAQSAEFYHWHEGKLGAVRRFCHLCYVDPMIVELYLGVRLSELFAD